MISRPEKRWVGRSFGAAAPGYDGVAGLQREVGARLLFHLPEGGQEPRVILDAGAGTGHFAAALSRRYPGARLIALDLAAGMLLRARERLGDPRAALCVGDAEALPLADRSIDLIFSNLTIQWCSGPLGVFREFRRVLRPRGRLLFSTFGPFTLSELRRAFAAADGFSHVNDFAGLPELAASLAEAGFAAPALDSEVRSIEYPDVLSLMRELKDLGAHNITAGRPRHLTGKGTLRKAIEAYEARTEAGIRASFETVYGHASSGDVS